MTRLAALVAAAVLAACGPSGGGDGDAGGAPAEAGLEPAFPPVSAAGSTTTPPAGDTTATTAPAAASTTTLPADPGTAPAAVRSASVTDPTGDLTVSAVSPPPWADLAGGRLTRSPDGFELRVALGGGTAPSSSGDPDRTMNVASFYDLDGDGDIDAEVWANLAEGGWGGSWFDNDAGTAAFVDDSGVAITVEGAEVVLRFPLSHLRDAERFRWSLASEYGSYATIGTELAARDDAPDGDHPVDFPQ